MNAIKILNGMIPGINCSGSVDLNSRETEAIKAALRLVSSVRKMREEKCNEDEVIMIMELMEDEL